MSPCTSDVEPHDGLGDARGLRFAVDLECRPFGGLHPARDLVDLVEDAAHADPVVDLDRVRKPQILESVVDDLADTGVDRALGDETAHHRVKRERQIAVRDRAAPGRLGRGARRIDVDPLMIAGGIREGVDARLADGEPVAQVHFLANAFRELREQRSGHVPRQEIGRSRSVRAPGTAGPQGPPRPPTGQSQSAPYSWQRRWEAPQPHGYRGAARTSQPRFPLARAYMLLTDCLY